MFKNTIVYHLYLLQNNKIEWAVCAAMDKIAQVLSTVEVEGWIHRGLYYITLLLCD